MITLDPSQERARDLIVHEPIACVTGGAGTGKTTTLRTALDDLDRRGEQYLLAAPTGKAAKRVTEATSRPAQTIHRLLGFTRSGFTFGPKNPLQTSAVVIDEASMLDIELAASLFGAIDPHTTRLVLMGDANQLPPVGPGCVFGDLVGSGAVPVARLTTLHRAAEQSWMNQAACAVLERRMPDITTARADFRFYAVDESVDILPKLAELVTTVIPNEIEAECQVLIPQRTGPAGIDKANAMLQAALNPPRLDAEGKAEPWIKQSDTEQLRIGDRVIQVKNNYDLEVFNGEVGEIADIRGGKALVAFADRPPVEYTLEQARALRLAYGLTVHKVQGSEFPWIVFVCHSTHTHMLSPQLIYTAITRGKMGVILVGNERGLRQGLRADNPPKRNTGLIERLRGEFAA